jgi:alpha-mannosidase
MTPDRPTPLMPGRTLVLVCNAHIDPVWLWPWREGLAQALSTFRAAAALCDEFSAFVFCHNEALLYRWVEEYEPDLFVRIRQLVRNGRWHVMGGWYVQPDCNLPSGESIVRQALVGKRYFLHKFGVEPEVAVNLDSFGHGRGLVQILRKAGYSGYLFCRPDRHALTLPADDFVWVGYDGSTLLAHRAADHYNSEAGRARDKAERWLAANIDRRCGLLLWGVGNHGGGASREDLHALDELMATTADRAIVHGRPEDYFAALSDPAAPLPRFAGELNPWGVGCYTSMSLVKQAHRRLENAFYAAEKTLAAAAIQSLITYPHTELAEALEDLLFCEFHDILAGSAVVEVEEQALQRLGHGLDLVGRLHTRAFFALLEGQAPAAGGEYPIFVHNPHPFAVDETLVCELQPPEPNLDKTVFLRPELTDRAGSPILSQLEKESCNIQIDQRKRVVFRARLAPSTVTRVSCRLEAVPRPEPRSAPAVIGPIRHHSLSCKVEIDGATGLVDRFCSNGVECLQGGSLKLLVMRDSADPWGMKVRSFREKAGEFRLMTPAEAAASAGVGTDTLAPVRVIEQGPVRTIVEALFAFERSTACLRCTLPAHGAEIEVEVLVHWLEKDRLLKLALPTHFAGGAVFGQAAYGVEGHDRRGEELVAQKWVAVTSADRRHALTVINDGIYGFDFEAGELRLSLLRSPAYAGHPVDEATPIVRQDRFENRIDQGERRFRFVLQGGDTVSRLGSVDREATVRNEPPAVLCAFPRGARARVKPGLILSDAVVQLGAMKLAEDGDRLVIRLFEPTGQARYTTVTIPPLDVHFGLTLGGYEVRTLAVDLKTREVFETDLLERRRESSEERLA